MSSDIINALRRLERAGSEESRSSQKLKDAADVLADAIIALVPRNHELPRSYEIQSLPAGRGLERVHLTMPDGDYHRPVEANRHTALVFAQDVASGWLDELADWLKARDHEASEAVAVLERATEAMR